jgi:hypothetical protein
MGMAIDQSGQDGRAAEVDPAGGRHILTNG